MRLGYFADGPWSHRALDKILDCVELQVIFIVGRYDRADPVLREYAERLGIPFYLHPNVNAPDFAEIIGRHEVDVNVSMSFNQILKSGIITSAPKGFINCHAGALPYYRGRNILNWALINGEKQFGVTVHYINEGIDTGEIILQQFAEITDNDDYGTLLMKAIDLCSTLLPEALLLIARDEVTRTSQATIHPVGFYCSQRKNGDEWIDWNLSSQRIHNLIRAVTIPGPGARTLLGDREIAIIKTELIQKAPSYIDRPGSIVGRESNAAVVKTGDTTLRIVQVADVDSGGLPVNVRPPNLRIGAYLGIDIHTLLAIARKAASPADCAIKPEACP